MDTKLKYLLITAIIFNIGLSGCSPKKPDDTTSPVSNTETVPTTLPDRAEPVATKPASAPVQTVEPVKNDVRVIYKDGKYVANSSYIAPNGKEDISVTVTLKNDIIESLELNQPSSNDVSRRYKEMFANGINEMVIGKPLAEIKGFKVVNGASLTPKGFNAAIEQIKKDAQA